MKIISNIKYVIIVITTLMTFSCNPGEVKDDITGGDKPDTGVNNTQFIGKTFYVESGVGNNNRFLQVEGANPNRLAPVNINLFTNGGEQYFTIRDAGDGYVYIQSNTQQKRALHIQESNKNPGANVNLWDIVNQDNLKWRFMDAGDGFYFIQSKLGTYLEVTNGSSSKKTPITTGNSKGMNAQKWKLHEVNKPITFKREFTIDPIRNLCPTRRLSGDGEFASNGPIVFGEIDVLKSRSSLEAVIEFNARETKPDWSHVKGEWKRNILTLPASWKIDRIVYPTRKSTFDYNTLGGMPSRGFQFIDSGRGRGTLSMERNGFVRRLRFIGDTGGNDISDDNNCTDDTRITKK